MKLCHLTELYITPSLRSNDRLFVKMRKIMGRRKSGRNLPQIEVSFDQKNLWASPLHGLDHPAVITLIPHTGIER